jgi:hypothetical protein
LTNPDVKSKSLIATVFTKGETIHFFNTTLRRPHNVTNFDHGECLRNGNIKLALHFKNSSKSVARVIGMDLPALEEFLVCAKNNTHALRSFLALTIKDLPQKSAFFKTITAEQVLY